MAKEFFCFRLFFVYIPHLEEHEGKASGSLPLKHYGGILPVSVFFILVYIFVCQINTAGKGCMSVDYKDFAVVPVVIVGGYKGRYGRKHLALYSQLMKPFRIIVRQS